MLIHVSIATARREPLFPRDQLPGVMRALASPAIVLLTLVDDHAHAVLDAEHPRTARGGLVRRLRALGAPPLAPSHVRTVEDRSHLLSLIRYHATQPAKHGILGCHPAAWPGSCVPDLIGARRIGLGPRRLSELLPRADVGAIALEAVGLPDSARHPATDHAIRALGPNALVDACGDALPDDRDAAIACFALARASGLAAPDLGLAPRTARRYRATAPDPTQLHAVRVRLSLDAACRPDDDARRRDGAANHGADRGSSPGDARDLAVTRPEPALIASAARP